MSFEIDQRRTIASGERTYKNTRIEAEIQQVVDRSGRLHTLGVAVAHTGDLRLRSEVTKFEVEESGGLLGSSEDVVEKSYGQMLDEAIADIESQIDEYETDTEEAEQAVAEVCSR